MTGVRSPAAPSKVALGIRIAWGCALAATPGFVLQLLGGADESLRARRILRLLGARHLLQAAALWRFGGTVKRAGVAVDSLHAASDIGFAIVDRRWRRAAATDAAITAGFAVLGATAT